MSAKAILGLIDRNGVPPFVSSDPMCNVLSGFVAHGAIGGGVTWAELQPTQGGPIASNNAIDKAINAARAQNSLSSQTRPWSVKIRAFTGENAAPAWAMALAGGPITGSAGKMGVWWSPAWIAAWEDFMTKLAAKYDSVPEIGEVVCGPSATQYMEPLSKNDFDSGTGLTSALRKGVYTPDWSWTADKANHVKAATFMQSVWTTTPMVYSFLPATDISGSPNPDMTFTLSLMDSIKSGVVASLGGLGNNSLRANNANGSTGLYASISSTGQVTDGHGTNYSTMYTHMRSLGPKGGGTLPITIQTATYQGLGGDPTDLGHTLDYAVNLGARCVELPAGYGAAGAAMLAKYHDLLAANDVPRGVVTPPPPLTVPAVPTGLTATNVTDTSLDLSWSSEQADGFYVYEDGIVSPPVTADTLAIASLLPGSTHHYGVLAYNSVGKSAESAIIAVTTLTTTPPPPPTSPIDTVVVIIMENKNYQQVMAPGAAPYLASLATAGAAATNAHGVSHPSAPNYLALITGTLLQAGSDAYNVYSVRNLVDLLEAAGVSWGAYMEDMGTDPTKSVNNYVVRHDPFAYMSDILKSPTRKAKIKPFSAFNPASMERFVFIVPNVMNDMHTGTIQQGDAWLKSHVPGILASPAFQKHSLLVVTFDEGDGSTTNQIVTIFGGPAAKPGAISNVSYNHYNLLHTIEQALGLGSLGTHDSAAVMSDMIH